jgi:hypothetical protein
MGAWKQFLASDIIVNPFVVNKGFTFTPGTSSGQFAYLGYTSSVSGEIINNDAVGINRFLGVNTNYYTNSTLTGQLTSSLSGSVPAYLADFVQYNQGLVYNSIKQLYYTNFLSSSTGDIVEQPVLVPGFNSSGDVLIGEIQSPLYDNFLQSTLVPTRFWPTASGAEIGVISIPSKLFGEYIVPTSFRLTSGSFSLIDDGEGNILLENTTFNFGNIIYTQGIVVLTNSASYISGEGGGPIIALAGYGISSYGSGIYGLGAGVTIVPGIVGFITGSVTCSFSSSLTIYETQYKCTLRESEFNATLNPSAQTSGSLLTVNSSSFYQRGDGTLANNVTGSYFSPYVTTVGLYDEAQNLLAIGKLAQPLPTSPTTDTTILINIDK